MKQLVLQTGCGSFKGDFTSQNASAANSLLAHIMRGCAQINDTSFPVYVDIIDTEKNVTDFETDSGAVMYIVAVLVFYSAGIIVMIVKYLRREKQELEEERILEDFFRSMPEYKREREQNKMNKIAIHAFHALTSFSENIVDDDDCSSVGEETMKREDTILEETITVVKTNEVDSNVPKEELNIKLTGNMIENDLQVTTVDALNSNIVLENETHL